MVRSHNLRDDKGRTLCPKLRIYSCEICGQDGDNAHTVKYCQKKPIITQEDTEKWVFKRKRGNFTKITGSYDNGNNNNYNGANDFSQKRIKCLKF